MREDQAGPAEYISGEISSEQLLDEIARLNANNKTLRDQLEDIQERYHAVSHPQTVDFGPCPFFTCVKTGRILEETK